MGFYGCTLIGIYRVVDRDVLNGRSQSGVDYAGCCYENVRGRAWRMLAVDIEMLNGCSRSSVAYVGCSHGNYEDTFTVMHSVC